jgi:hypothetical protein
MGPAGAPVVLGRAGTTRIDSTMWGFETGMPVDLGPNA